MPSKANLAKIHIARKELNLDDDTYRDILHVQFGKASASDLSELQAARLVEHFKTLGWQPKQARRIGQKPRNAAVPSRKELMEKIEACLTERQLPWSYAETMARNICKKAALEFCGPRDLWKVAAAFGYDAKRKGLPK